MEEPKKIDVVKRIKEKRQKNKQVKIENLKEEQRNIVKKLQTLKKEGNLPKPKRQRNRKRGDYLSDVITADTQSTRDGQNVRGMAINRKTNISLTSSYSFTSAIPIDVIPDQDKVRDIAASYILHYLSFYPDTDDNLAGPSFLAIVSLFYVAMGGGDPYALVKHVPKLMQVEFDAVKPTTADTKLGKYQYNFDLIGFLLNTSLIHNNITFAPLNGLSSTSQWALLGPNTSSPDYTKLAALFEKMKTVWNVCEYTPTKWAIHSTDMYGQYIQGDGGSESNNLVWYSETKHSSWLKNIALGSTSAIIDPNRYANATSRIFVNATSYNSIFLKGGYMSPREIHARYNYVPMSHYMYQTYAMLQKVATDNAYFPFASGVSLTVSPYTAFTQIGNADASQYFFMTFQAAQRYNAYLFANAQEFLTAYVVGTNLGFTDQSTLMAALCSEGMRSVFVSVREDSNTVYITVPYCDAGLRLTMDTYFKNIFTGPNVTPNANGAVNWQLSTDNNVPVNFFYGDSAAQLFNHVTAELESIKAMQWYRQDNFANPSKYNVGGYVRVLGDEGKFKVEREKYKKLGKFPPAKPKSYGQDDNPDSLQVPLIVTASQFNITNDWTYDREMVLPVEFVEGNVTVQSLVAKHVCVTGLYTNVSNKQFIIDVYNNQAISMLVPTQNGSESELSKVLKTRFGGLAQTLFGTLGGDISKGLQMIPEIGPIIGAIDNGAGMIYNFFKKKR